MKTHKIIKNKKRLLVPLVVLLLAVLTTMAVFADTETLILDTGGSVTITDASKDFVITQADSATVTTNTITVNVGAGNTANITVSGLNISTTGCAFKIDSGTVNLTLEGNNNLQSGQNYAGLHNGTNRLNITAASVTDTLSVTGGPNGAGIGCGGTNYDLASYITISGGTINATGGDYGAGIGGGGYYSAGRNITISGGNVTAVGGQWAAGIGGGCFGSGRYINISGGTVTATGDVNSAGIGGGDSGSCDFVNISGGTVAATGGDNAAGIGGGDYGYCGKITISGGSVKAVAGYNANSIGGGANGNGAIIPKNTAGQNVYLATKDSLSEQEVSFLAEQTEGVPYYSMQDANPIDGSYRMYLPEYSVSYILNLAGATNPNAPINYNVFDSINQPLLDAQHSMAIFEFIGWDAGTEITGQLVIPAGTKSNTTLNANWEYPEEFTYYLDTGGNVTISDTNMDYIITQTDSAVATWHYITVDVGTGNTVNITLRNVNIDDIGTNLAPFKIISGTVNLTLEGNNILRGGSYAAGLQNGTNPLIIGAASTADSLTATSNNYGAGIGGGDSSAGGNIAINGGTVTAIGGGEGAGIGGGQNGNGSNITITGGIVVAQGGSFGAGIGGGLYGAGSNILISGGTTTATGGTSGAGIGGALAAGSEISISGGTVNATGGDGSAGIGGMPGSNINISGGSVTAIGGNYGAGIGGDDSSSGSGITISGGSVKAVAGKNANNIGGGAHQSAVTPKNSQGQDVYLVNKDTLTEQELGWLAENSDGVPYYNMAGANPIDSSYMLYLPRYFVTFNLNLEGAVNPNTAPLNYIVFDTVPLTDAQPNNQLYAFNGWYDAENNKWTDIQEGLKENITLDAGWIDCYNITFDANGGEGGISRYMPFGTALTPPAVTKPGYAFTGWSPSVPSTVPADDTTYTAQWVHYLITFDANGGTGGTSGYMAPGSALLAPAVIKTGYTFTGWQPEAPATVPSADAVYTAQWQVNQYIITFFADGGTGGTSETMDYGSALTAPVVSRMGYTFVGWSPDAPVTVPAVNTTYTAQWQVNQYTMTFNANGGTGSATFLKDYDSVLSAPAVYREGYTFAGWQPEVPGRVGLGDAVYTAQWQAKQYTITFDANGGTGGTSGLMDCDAALTPPAVTKTGYSLTGWSPSVPETVPIANTTYMAQWTANTYTITYNGNSSTSGSTADTLLTYNIQAKLTENGFKKTGYTLLGWSEDASATTPSYMDNEHVFNLAATPNAVITFYAVWSVNSYTITFNANGGSGGTSSQKAFGAVLIAPTVAKAGYTFTGWTPDVPETVPAADSTYTAQWSANQYLVTFDTNGGEGGTSGLMTCGAALSAPTVTRTGYTLAGWSPAVPGTVPPSDTVYTANWAPNQYRVTFNTAGGTGGWSDYRDYGSVLTAPEVTRTGCTFLGWSPEVPTTVGLEDATYTAQWSVNQYLMTFDANGGTGGTSGLKNFGLPLTAPFVSKTGHILTAWSPAVPETVPGENRTFVAQWTPDQYTITFNANGGTGGTSGQMDYDSALTAPAVTRTGYTLTGWLPAVPATVGVGNKTYKAQWTINQYTFTYDDNGGTGGTNVTVNYGAALTPPDVSKEGYTFVGWQPAVPATAGASNAVYTAQWMVQPILITFDANGGDGGSSAYMEYGDPLTAPALTRIGYTFLGWSPDVPETVGEYATTYTANWSRNQYTIIFDANGGTGGRVDYLNYGDALSAPQVSKTGYLFTGWSPAVPATAPDTDTVYTAQYVKTELKLTTLATGLKVNITGWTEGYFYQIWSFQKITGDFFLDNAAGVSAAQWILSKPYTTGTDSGAVAEPDGSISFIIDDFVSPDSNYTAAVRIADADFNFVGELRDSFTPADVSEVKITKILLDGEYSDGKEIREISYDSPYIFTVIGNNVPDTTYMANVAETGMVLTGSTPGEFVLDTASFAPGNYTVEFTATNGTTSDSRKVFVQLYSKFFNMPLGSISSLELTAVEGNDLPKTIGIVPTMTNGSFWYRISEPGRTAFFTSGLQWPGDTIEYNITKFGIYQVSGFVNNPFEVKIGNYYDDGFIKSLTVSRSQTEPSSVALAASADITKPIDKATPLLFTASADIGGIGSTPVQYSFWRYDAKGYVLVKDWSSDNTLAWTPARVGNYTIAVRVKGVDAGSYEAASSVKVNVTAPDEEIAKGVVITINEAELNANAAARVPVYIKASATSTNSEDLLYKFYVNDEAMGTSTLQNYSADQNCIWTPRKAGTYTISVLVKNGTSFGAYDAIEAFEVTVD